jgi:multidrug transporter EmrE-like cation transporter
MVLAIAALPAGVVFPISTACVISLNVILGRMLWTERIAPRQVAGLALAMVVAVLANV